jgi:solute carrier family 13 (sodium-dependent dicarboxylate transporter), member 2/3/5
VVGGFMLASAFLSMWVSNTATAAMMLPIGLSVIQLIGQSPLTDARSLHRLSLALLLGIAFGANIGGMATLIGTPPNALLAGFLRERHGLDVGFLQWLLVGLPTAATLLPLAWVLLTRWLFPLSGQRVLGVEELLAEQRGWLGRLEGGELRVALICVATALAWMTRPWLDSLLPGMRLTDAGIAVSAGVLLVCMPGTGGRMLLDWEATRELPWGVLLLVGGGLSLGSAVEASGLSVWIAQSLGLLAAWPLWLLIVALALCVMLASHVTSNTATAATFIPLAAGLALGLGEAPILLTVPVALAASCAFMLPVATPPNAIVFASGRLRVADMARAGAWLSVLALAVVTLAALVLAPLVFG